jgi:hypothetical protein
MPIFKMMRLRYYCEGGWYATTFNNILVIPWQSVLLVEVDPGKTTYLSQVTEKLYRMLCTSPWSRFELTTLVVIGTDYIGSCKSNYHTITATTAPTSIGVSVLRLILVILICPMTTIYLNNFWTIVRDEPFNFQGGLWFFF